MINFLYLYSMERKIKTYGGYFEKFMETLTVKEQDKVQYALLLLKKQNRVSVKFIKHIQDDLYELRIESNGNIYRVFFIFDEGNLIVLFSGFQKNTTKRNK